MIRKTEDSYDGRGGGRIRTVLLVASTGSLRFLEKVSIFGYMALMGLCPPPWGWSVNDSFLRSALPGPQLDIRV
jgi:hypothetical protein